MWSVYTQFLIWFGATSVKMPTLRALRRCEIVSWLRYPWVMALMAYGYDPYGLPIWFMYYPYVACGLFLGCGTFSRANAKHSLLTPPRLHSGTLPSHIQVIGVLLHLIPAVVLGFRLSTYLSTKEASAILTDVQVPLTVEDDDYGGKDHRIQRRSS